MNPVNHEWWRHLPEVNASLNAASAILLLVAFVMVKQRRYVAHATFIIAALVTSAAFLTCYLIFHGMKARHHEGLTHFPASHWQPVYFTILISHTFLAIVILPLIARSLWLAWKRRWKSHHQMSVITWPLWMYVSITGVVVYWMLYHLAPTLTQ